MKITKQNYASGNGPGKCTIDKAGGFGSSVINKALLRENLRRFWSISAVAALLFFISGPLYLLSSDYLYYSTLEDTLLNKNFGYILIECALPVIVCAAVFGYLYKGASTTVFHAFPITRTQLYCTSMASGMVLTALPAVFNALVLAVMRLCNQLVFQNPEFDVTEGTTEGLLWNLSGILQWLAIALVIMFFIFAVSGLSAVISGNGVINVLTAMALNLVAPVLVLCFYGYCSDFIYGYCSSMENWTLLRFLHPLVCFLSADNDLIVRENGTAPVFLPWILIYLAVSLLLMAGACFLYGRRSNENTGNSYIFRPVSFIIGLIMVFIGACIFGMLFYDSIGLWGYCIGVVISLLAGQMIIQKTFRIFNRHLLPPAAAAVGLFLLMLLFFRLDLAGIETWVPEADSYKRVTLYCSDVDCGVDICLDSESGKEAVEAFHRQITENRTSYRRFVSQNAFAYEDGKNLVTYVSIDYTMNDGSRRYREYWIPLAALYETGAMEDLLGEAVLAMDETTLAKADPYQIEVDVTDYSRDDDDPSSAEITVDAGLLRDALLADLKERTIEDHLGLNDPSGEGYCNIYLDFCITQPASIQDSLEAACIPFADSYRCYYDRDESEAVTDCTEYYSFYVNYTYPRAWALLKEQTE